MYEPRFRTIAQPEGPPTADVYWITHAGGGTNTLVHRLRSSEALPACRVHSPWMPLREELSEITFDGDLNQMASLLGGQIAGRHESGDALPIVVIGHSFGSVLAYRVTSDLVERGIIPHRLVVLSFPAPDDLNVDQKLHLLSDDELIRQVDAKFGGMPQDILDDSSSQAYFARALRFDFALMEGYEHPSTARQIPSPIVAICGTDDRAVDVADMHRWSRMTESEFRLRSMPGDHFFPIPRMEEVLEVAVWDVSPG